MITANQGASVMTAGPLPLSDEPCAGGHQFVWQSPRGAWQYSVPAGLRCECGAVAFDDLVDEAGRCGRIKDVKRNADGEPQGEPTGCNAPRVGSIAGTPANENAEGWPCGDAARPTKGTTE